MKVKIRSTGRIVEVSKKDASSLIKRGIGEIVGGYEDREGRNYIDRQMHSSRGRYFEEDEYGER